MALKTLKDFESKFMFYDKRWNKRNRIAFFRFGQALRREAIQWIKLFEFGTPKGLKPLTPFTINWIKHFFNITEEDLK